ncbi:hypothetical protein MAR_004389 [Mya arenaria]|uniref:C2H2-type domain-containing protein n=1 Tax=Mya arenaria TaxID=6604 RepID=A0ABY7F0L3_MYAAR|nr:hypothetical protein MAR_004389 [Mya arenaria]
MTTDLGSRILQRVNAGDRATCTVHDVKIVIVTFPDDLFYEAGKDKGSHHRSLSVISIKQNLFGNKDPIQKRNCHYLVLFNNPIVRQSVMTLARQMFPGQTEKFMKAFEKAIKFLYGCLLVDLKPFTDEDKRLKCDIFLAKQDRNSSNRESLGVQTDHSAEISDNENTMAEKGQNCDDCGALFDTTHDVQRHVNNGWYPESREPPAKRLRPEEDSENERKEDIDEYDGFIHLWEISQKQNKDKFNKVYDQYIDEGHNEEDSYEMALERTQSFKENIFFDTYQRPLEMYWLPLLTNASSRNIVEQIDKLRHSGVSLPPAVKRVLLKYKHEFQYLFEQSDDSGNESDDESSDSDEQ